MKYLIKLIILFLLVYLNTELVYGQNVVSVNGAGWKRIAYNSVPHGRGFGKVSLYTSGGSYTPEYVEIDWFKDWTSQTGIRVESNGNTSNYWSEARVTFTADTSFIEVYFTRAIVNSLYVNIDPFGWNPGKAFSGPLPDGGGTVGALAKIHRFNLKDQFVVGFNGNVGIGTNSPQEALSVNGNIRAKEIKVEASHWPDYVFDETYKMMELKDLEKYIKENNHLPGIPKAKEVETDGLKLGEMNKRLLKKIEELTLYIIEKDQQFNLLNNEVKDLKGEVKKLSGENQ